MKILYVTTISGTINAFLKPHIEMLIEAGHTVDIACNMIEPIDGDLTKKCKLINLEFVRSPMKFKNFKAYLKLKKIIVSNQYDIVHTHTPIASACVRIACMKLKKTKVFYTAHGFHFFKGSPIKNWIIYFPIEYLLSRYTDTIITINREDYKLARNKFKSRNIKYIPGVGLDTHRYKYDISIRSSKRKEIGITDESFVILSVGELNRNKNHETVIKAISSLNNTRLIYLICGKGPLENHLNTLIKKLDLEKQVMLLGYRKDIDELCNMADVFIFPSKREGLGMAALEAMASGLPLITSNVHGIVDYSIDGKTGFIYNPEDIKGFAKGIRILENDLKLQSNIKKYNLMLINKYDLNNVLLDLTDVYNLEKVRIDA